MSSKKKQKSIAEKVWPTEELIYRRRKQLRDHKDIISLFARMAGIVIFLGIFFQIFFGIHTVNGSDMEPRLSDGDLVLFFRMSSVYYARDVVIYHGGDRTRAGRIVARPNDEIEISQGGVIINGYLTAEDGIYQETPDYDERVQYPLQLNDDEYFILADYREGARDSRIYGAITKSDILGKVITVIRSNNF